MSTPWTRIVSLSVGLWLVAGTTSCTSPLTEVLVVIDSDLAIPAELDELRIDLIGPDASLKRSLGRLSGVRDLPRTLGVVHRGGALGPVNITVTGLANGTSVVQRRASFSFVSGEVRILRLDLLRQCVGVRCDSTQSCGPAGCAPIEVADERLLPYDESLVGRRDAGMADSGGTDADAGCVPQPETCNERDDDCDTRTDETFDLTSSMLHCGRCDNACPTSPEHGSSRCVSSSCDLSCDDGFADCNGVRDDGCEADLSAAGTCGDCEVECGGAEPFCAPTLEGFACQAGCGAGLTECGMSCIDLSSDPRHCGGCGVECASVPNAEPVCVAPACGFECDEGFQDCNASATDGCESRLRELDNCGSCGVACSLANASESCESGDCEVLACEPGFGDCDRDPATGCEEDLDTNLLRCGDCGNACPTDPPNAAAVCTAGTCALSCDEGFADCDGEIDTGCETNLGASPNCGACGVICEAATPICAVNPSGGFRCEGVCTGGTTCGMSCVDTETDISHCGGCNMPCTAGINASPTCVVGSCSIVCDSGFADCDMDAVSCEASLEEPATCGDCETSCPGAPQAIPACDRGVCDLACNPGYADCNGDPADGCEADLALPATCGTCAPCPVGNQVVTVDCVSGACLITECNAPFADCDGSPANGCERDTSSSKQHCGGCGNACSGSQRCCDSVCSPHGTC